MSFVPCEIYITSVESVHNKLEVNTVPAAHTHSCLLTFFFDRTNFPSSHRIIGQRWKNIDPDRLQKYSELASEDTERYKGEMQEYNGRQEAKMRSEALKPVASFPSSSAGGPSERGVSSYPDARGGYGDMSAVGGFPGMPMPSNSMGPPGGPAGPTSMAPGAMMGGYGYGYGDFSGYGNVGMNP